MNRTARIVRLTALGAAGIVSAQFAIATDVVTTRAVNAQAQAQAQYQGQGGLPQTRNSGWTDAEFAAARPLMPQASYLPAAVFDFNAAVAEAANAVSAVSVNGSEGGANAKQLREESRWPRVVRFVFVAAVLDLIAGPQTCGAGRGQAAGRAQCLFGGELARGAVHDCLGIVRSWHN